ncbi:MAG: DNA ligase D [Alphaproteobacteria bacterium]|nr:DNA ligase D [Alphaproteobacteria bacterium]
MADALSTYRAKRDFRATPEPKGRVKRTKGRLFVVQKHDATRLHYDFRLELDGVLLSWAVTRGPSLNPADKRLAVRVEDHPVAYGGFEGVIRSGYGAGTVMLWDRGSWAPQEDPHEGLKKGSLKIVLNGERLKGGFALVRMKPRPGEKASRENWLLIKEHDDWANDKIVATDKWTKSVKTARGLDGISREGDAYKRGKTYRVAGKTTPQPSARKTRKAAKSAKASTKAAHTATGAPNRRKKAGAKKGKRPRAQAERIRPQRTVKSSMTRRTPRFIPPQLATLVKSPPSGTGWLHEVKFDGYRIIAVICGGRARLFTRNQKDWTERYRRVATWLEALGLKDGVLDGELVATDETGKADFSLMQAAGQDADIPLTYYLFDLLNLDGEDLSDRPLIERKAQLALLLQNAPDGLKYSEHIVGDGDKVIASACGLKMEGIVSKEAAAPYRSGRVGSWLKSKCIGNDEFVIGGFSKSDKAGRPFASLLLGEHEGGKLVYRGRVGTGFDQADMERLAAKFRQRKRKTSPFDAVPREARDAVWLKPDLVAQVAYFERTPDGLLRHPSFLGLREDKPASDVGEGKQERAAVMKSPSARSSTSASSGKSSTVHARGDAEVHGVRISSPGKVLWPEAGVTKLMLAEYYAQAADHMLPFLKDRPLSLVRCPDGRTGECFFQKHHNPSTPSELETVEIEEKDGGRAAYLVVRSAKGLIAAAQVSGMELHVWGARTDQLEKPERIVFDLDPDEGLTFSDVRAAAVEVRDVLASANLESYPLLTGGKGIHVVVPIIRRTEWPEVKAFARGFAEAMAKASPDRYVARAAKAKRTGRIFIDWLRNERGATAVAPYSLRAREGASVATPVSWDELETVETAAAFTFANIGSRLVDRKNDPWAGYHNSRQSLTAGIRRAFS